MTMPPKKILDPEQIMPVLEELLAQGQTVNLTVTGSSMAPFLRHGRDQIRFRRPDRPLKRGDMAFFRRPNGQYVMHRVARVTSEGLWLIGDGQQSLEGPVPEGRVFAVVTQVCRKGRWIGPGHPCWAFFRGPWLRLLPLRPYLRKFFPDS